MEIKANNAEVTINLNSHIKFKCKEDGYQRMADNYNKAIEGLRNHDFRVAEHYKSMVDSDGYLKTQIWMFLREFGGDTVYLGLNDLIYLDVIFMEG